MHLSHFWIIHGVLFGTIVTQKKLGFQNIDIDAIECLKEVDQKYEEEPYYLLQQKLANNSVFQVEIWENEDGTYEGLKRKKYPSQIGRVRFEKSISAIFMK